MHIISYCSFDQLVAIQSEWNELAGDDPFNQFEWHRSWWESFGSKPIDNSDSDGRETDARSLFVIVVTDESSKVVAIAPWYRQRCGTRGQVIRFLASGPTRPIHSAVLAREGYGDEALSAIGDWLQGREQQWDAIEFAGVTSDDCRLPSLIGTIAEEGTPVYRTTDNRRFQISLPSNWTQYISNFAPATQLRLDHIVQEYVNAGRVDFDVIADPKAFVEQCGSEFGEPTEDMRGIDQRLCDWLRTAIANVRGLGLLALVLKLDGEVVATQLVLQAKGTWHRIYYSICVDDDREVIDELSMMMLVHMAIDRGVEEVDLVSSDPLDALAWQGKRSNYLHLQLAASSVPQTPLMGLVFSNEGTAKNWCKQGMNLAGLH